MKKNLEEIAWASLANYFQRALAQKSAEAQSLRLELQYKERMVQDVRHELANALMFIRGYSSLLLKEDPCQDPVAMLRKGLEMIHKNTETCNLLLEDLQQACGLSQGPVSLTLQPVSAKRLCELAVKSLDLVAQQKGVALLLDGVPEDKVEADPKRILQILSNLVLNALKFTPVAGQISLGACKTGNFMRFCVRDTGMGIEPGDLERVFERSYQGERDGSGRGGQGLGLAIARKLVEAHGGRIWAEKQPAGAGEAPAHGSHFYFTLPLCDQQTFQGSASLVHTKHIGNGNGGNLK